MGNESVTEVIHPADHQWRAAMLALDRIMVRAWWEGDTPGDVPTDIQVEAIVRQRANLDTHRNFLAQCLYEIVVELATPEMIANAKAMADAHGDTQ